MGAAMQMALNGEREKYFGELLQREASALEALCRAPGADTNDCGSSPEVQRPWSGLLDFLLTRLAGNIAR